MSIEDETAPVEDEAPVTEIAAPGETEAPASPPEGYIEQDRYENLRREFNQRQSLWNRAQQGDLEAMRELNLPVDFGDDSPEEEEDPAFQDPRVDALLKEREAEQAQKQQEEGWNRFNADLDKIARGKDLSQRDRLAIYTDTVQAGGDPDALKNVFNDFVKEREAYDKAVIQRYIESKRAPHVSPGGTGATDEVLPLDASHKDRVRYMTERYQLGQQS